MTLSFAPERIETWPLSRLQPYAKNAKVHATDQVAKIAASMAEFGWTVPCLVAEDGELIAGHGRVLAATQLGLTEAPVIVLGHLTEAQRRAYRIADNKLTELGSWDEALLSAELQGLLAEDFDLSLVGFSDGELDKLLALDPDADDEDSGAGGSVPPVTIPEPPRNPASRKGDLWLLGDHRLLCGDSTNHDDVRRLMNGEQAILFAHVSRRNLHRSLYWRSEGRMRLRRELPTGHRSRPIRRGTCPPQAVTPQGAVGRSRRIGSVREGTPVGAVARGVMLRYATLHCAYPPRRPSQRTARKRYRGLHQIVSFVP